MSTRFLGICGLMLSGCHELFGLDDHITLDPGVMCPSSYDLEDARTSSRYQLILEPRRHADQAFACAQDARVTQLASLETMEEFEAVRSLLTIHGAGAVWVGATQAGDQISPADGWTWLTGPAIDPALWITDQPSDDDGVEDNDENVAVARVDDPPGMLQDRLPNHDFPALCECDPTRR